MCFCYFLCQSEAVSPDAPTLTYDTSTMVSITLDWAPGASTGGLAIASYELQYKLSSATTSAWIPLTLASVTATTHTTSGLVAGNEYSFRVRAVHAGGASAWSTVHAYACDTPADPDDLAIVQRTTAFAEFSWTAPTATGGCPILGYIVFKDGKHVGTVSDSTITSYTHSFSGAAGQSHVFKVQTENWKTRNKPRDIKVINALQPGSVTDLAISTNTLTAVSLTFTDPASNGGSAITGRTVQITDGVGGTTFYDVGVSVGSTTLTENAGTYTAQITGLTTGYTYSFRVYCKNAVTETNALTDISYSYSNEVTQITALVPDAPSTPTFGSRTATGLSLSWGTPANANGAIVSSYQVLRSAGHTVADYDALNAVVVDNIIYNGNDLSSVVTSLTAGYKYAFCIKATNAAGASACSTNLEVIIGLVPSGMASPTRNDGGSVVGTIRVDFTAPTDIGADAVTGYIVQRDNGPGTDYADGATINVGAEAAKVANFAGLTNGVIYRVQVAATNSVGTSIYSAPLTVADCDTPGDAQAMVLSASDHTSTSVKLSWDPASVGAGNCPTDRFEVYTQVGGVSTKVADVLPSVLSYTLSNMVPGSSYTISAKQCNKVICSDPVALAAMQPGAVPSQPAAPTVDAATAINSLVIDWAAPASDLAITGYNIYWSGPDGSGAILSTPLANVNALTATITNNGARGTINGNFDGAVNENTVFRIQISAVSANGESQKSPVLDIINCDAPPTPTNLIYSSSTSTSITVQWTAPTLTGGNDGKLKEYSVKYKDLTANGAEQLMTVPAATLEATVTGLTQGNNYQVSVAACNLNFCGTYTNTLSLYSGNLPDAPNAATFVSAVENNANNNKVDMTFGWSYSGKSNNGLGLTSYTYTTSSSNGGDAGASSTTVESGTTQGTYTCTKGATLTVVLTADNLAGSSASQTSTISCGRVPYAAGATQVPSSFVVTSTAASFTWNTPGINDVDATTFLGINIHAKQQGDSSYELIQVRDPTATFHSVGTINSNALQPGQTYLAYIEFVSTAGTSAASTEVTVQAIDADPVDRAEFRDGSNYEVTVVYIFLIFIALVYLHWVYNYYIYLYIAVEDAVLAIVPDWESLCQFALANGQRLSRSGKMRKSALRCLSNKIH